MSVFTAWYVLPTKYIYLFSVDLRTNRAYFTIQHYVTAFIPETECVNCAVCSANTVYFCVFITEAVLLRGKFCRNNVFMSDYFTLQHW
jgi:hypothetical protein